MGRIALRAAGSGSAMAGLHHLARRGLRSYAARAAVQAEQPTVHVRARILGELVNAAPNGHTCVDLVQVGEAPFACAISSA
jgi:hypothetical protein